jgi:uncharacterized protein
VAPDGTSAYVTGGVLNLTHRGGHRRPEPLAPGVVYEVRVPFKAAAYRFRPGHRIRVSLAAGAWPLLWPSPYASTNVVHRGPAYASRLSLPVVPESALGPPPEFKTQPPDLIEIGSGSSEPARWLIAEDVINQTVTVTAYDGDTSILPEGRALFTSERIEMTAHQADPLKTRLYQEVIYRLDESGYQTEVRSSGGLRCTETHFVIDIQLRVVLNGNLFFERSWLENIPRRGV